MKKISILAAGLLLTACGGGGGSSHSGSSASVYVAPRAAVSSAVVTSNREITNMSPEIVVSSDGSAPRVAGSVSTTNNGVTYTSYRLDDINLYVADNLGAPSYINLELNEGTGEIDAVRMVIGGEDSGSIARSTEDTTAFAGPIFEYVPNDSDKAEFRVVDNGQTWADLETLAEANGLSGGHWNRIDERMLFTTYGKDIGLKYADFGHFNPIYTAKSEELTSDGDIEGARNRVDRETGKDKFVTDEEVQNLLETDKDYQLFAGGYAINGTTLQETLSPENGTSYTGKAIGRVYASIQGGGEGRAAKLSEWDVPSESDGHDMAQDYITSAARLTIDEHGIQTLKMPFNTASDDSAKKFYDVTITQTAGGTPDFVFEGAPSEAQYRYNTTEENIEKAFTPGYYGVNTPEEAAGTALYASEQDLEDGFTREWEFQAAYGMKKD